MDFGRAATFTGSPRCLRAAWDDDFVSAMLGHAVAGPVGFDGAGGVAGSLQLTRPDAIHAIAKHEIVRRWHASCSTRVTSGAVKKSASTSVFAPGRRGRAHRTLEARKTTVCDCFVAMNREIRTTEP